VSHTIDEIEKKVIAIIAEQAMLDVQDVTAKSTLEEIGIDSLGVVESIFSIEEEFDISVPFNANEPEKSDFDISTVGSIANAIFGLLSEKPA